MDAWVRRIETAGDAAAAEEAALGAVREGGRLAEAERQRPGQGLKPARLAQALARVRQAVAAYNEGAGAQATQPWLLDLLRCRSALVVLRTCNPLEEPFGSWFKSVEASLRSLGSAGGAACEEVPATLAVLEALLGARERWSSAVRLTPAQRAAALAKDTLYARVMGAGLADTVATLVSRAEERMLDTPATVLMSLGDAYHGAFPCARCSEDFGAHTRGTCAAGRWRGLGEALMRAGRPARGLAVLRRSLAVLRRRESLGTQHAGTLELAVEIGSLAMRTGHPDVADAVHDEIMAGLGRGDEDAAAPELPRRAGRAGKGPVPVQAMTPADGTAGAVPAAPAQRRRQRATRGQVRQDRRALGAVDRELRQIRAAAPVQRWPGGGGGGRGGGGATPSEVLARRRKQRQEPGQAATAAAAQPQQQKSKPKPRSSHRRQASDLRNLDREIRALRAAAPVSGPPPPGAAIGGGGSGSDSDEAEAAASEQDGTDCVVQ